MSDFHTHHYNVNQKPAADRRFLLTRKIILEITVASLIIE